MKAKLVQLAAPALSLAAMPLFAQVTPGNWGGVPYDRSHYDYPEPPGARDPREGKIQVQTFVAVSPHVADLGHGSIEIAAHRVSSMPTAEDLFETAVGDQLARAGYKPQAPGPRQKIEYVVTSEVIQPPEPPHSPVHGGVGLGVGNYGSGMGLGIAIDLSKPRGALIATRIDARISDAVTHELLWQGRAEVMARENDKHWRPEAVAGRLSAALFRNFPRPTTR